MIDFFNVNIDPIPIVHNDYQDIFSAKVETTYLEKLRKVFNFIPYSASVSSCNSQNESITKKIKPISKRFEEYVRHYYDWLEMRNINEIYLSRPIDLKN